MKERFFFLDLVRAFSLICIIWCHTNTIEFDSYLFEKIKWFIGKCGVPLFFIISGYLAFPQNKPIVQYFTSKVNRVVIPFLLWVVIYAITETLSNNPIVLDHDILNEGSAHLWFIYVIIGLYLTVPILDSFLRNVNKKILQFYLLIWVVTTLFPLIIFKFNIQYYEHNVLYTLNSFFGYIGYFVLGFYVRRYGADSRLFKTRTIIGCLISSFLLIGIYFFVFDCRTVIVSDYKGLPILLYSIAVLGILYKLSPIVERFKYRHIVTSLSIYSFGIYLCHMIVVRYLYPYFPNFEWMPGLLSTLCYVMINVFICYGFVYLINRFRFSKYLLG